MSKPQEEEEARATKLGEVSCHEKWINDATGKTEWFVDEKEYEKRKGEVTWWSKS